MVPQTVSGSEKWGLRTVGKPKTSEKPGRDEASLHFLTPFRIARDSPGATMTQFDHEKLNVYRAAVTFVAWSHGLLAEIPKGIAVHNQFDRASTSIPLNIAEGNGKFTSADRCRFFDTARGSAFECAACLDVLVAKTMIEQAAAAEGKRMLHEIVSMLVGLIRSNSKSRDV